MLAVLSVVEQRFLGAGDVSLLRRRIPLSSRTDFTEALTSPHARSQRDVEDVDCGKRNGTR